MASKFLVRLPDAKSGKLVSFMTPLLVALILVEIIDLVFAVDSVPAVFAITQDPFIVYTSNIFAILGLRSLYFALAAAMNRFKYLQISLAIVLVLVGCKIFLVPWASRSIRCFHWSLRSAFWPPASSTPCGARGMTEAATP